MKSNTATTATAIASGIAYVSAVNTSQELLWLFGEQIAQLLEATPKDLKQGVKIVIAKQIAKETDKNVKTIQNKIGNALACYAKFVAPSDASYYTMRELNGQGKTTPKKKGRRTDAVKALESKVIALTDAEFIALCDARKASKKK